MRTNSTLTEATVLAKPELNHLEMDWRRAWESCSHAAQIGNYAEAERWHRQATQLGDQLSATDRVFRKSALPPAQS